MARKIKTRAQRPSIPTIIGAGITEQWYFSHLQTLFGCRIKVRPRFFGQEDIFQLSKKIESVVASGGFAIAVFDADVTRWNASEYAKLERMRNKYAHNPNVIICDSMPSVEYWFLLHFSDIHRMFPTSDSVIRELVRYLPDFEKSSCFLSNPKWVSRLCGDNRLQQAVLNAAKSLPGQSYTNMPKALKKILPNPLPSPRMT